MTVESKIPAAPRENAVTLTCDQIAEILPHRYPFALVDRILDMEPGQWAMGRKCVSGNEAFFCGHFPGHKVMPGVLILEAMAQVGGVALLCQPENKGKLALFGGIKHGPRGLRHGPRLRGRQAGRPGGADLCPGGRGQRSQVTLI